MANQRLNATIQIGGTVAKSLTKGLGSTRERISKIGDSIKQVERTRSLMGRFDIDGLRETRRELGDAKARVGQLSEELKASKSSTRQAEKAYQEAQDRVASLADEMRRADEPSEVLRHDFEEAKKEAGQLGKALEGAKKDTSRLSRDMRGAENQAEALDQQFQVQRESLRDVRRQLHEAGVDTRNLGEESEALERKLASLQKRQERWQRVQETGAETGERFGTMTREVGTLARGTGIALGGMATAVGLVTHTTATSNEELNQYARRLGVTTEWLSRTQYAAGQFGITNDALVDGVKELSMRADEFAQTGVGPAAEAFDRLGFSQKEVNSLSKDTAELFRVVRDRMTSIQDPAARQRIADEIFGGEAGEQFIEYLQLSREQVDKLKQEATAAGAEVTESQVKASRAYMRSWHKVTGVLTGLRNTIGTALMPVVGGMMDQLSGWLVENRDRVDEFATTMAEGLEKAVPMVGDLLRGLATTAKNIGHAAVVVADLVGGFDNLGMIIGTVIAGKAIASVVSFGMAIFQVGSALVSLSGGLPLVAGGIKAIGTALMANPIGLIIGAIAGAAYLIYKNWDWIGPWFGKLWDGITGAAAWAWDKLKTIVSFSPLGLIVNNWSAVSGAIGDVVGAAKDVAGAAWDWMKDKLSWSPLGAISNAWGGLKGWFGNLWDGITATAEKALDWVVGKLEWVGNAFSKVKGWLGFGGGDDNDEASQRPSVGGVASRPEFGSDDREQERLQRSSSLADNALPPPRPALAGGSASTGERVREVTQKITNDIKLIVSRREGEEDQSYAERIAEMVMEKINERQEGALYDG